MQRTSTPEDNARERRRACQKGVNFDNKFIYYVGPVDAVGDEVIGPAGPTTATRMDRYTDMMLENTKILRDDRQG